MFATGSKIHFAFVAWGKPLHFNSMVLLSSAALTASELAFPLSPYLTKGIYKTMLSAYINVVSVWTVFRYCRTVPYFGPEYKLWLFTFLFFLTRQVIRVAFLPSQYIFEAPSLCGPQHARARRAENRIRHSWEHGIKSVRDWEEGRQAEGGTKFGCKLPELRRGRRNLWKIDWTTRHK